MTGPTSSEPAPAPIRSEPGGPGWGLARTEEDGVVWLQLARPERRNALTSALLRALREQIRALGDDPVAKVVVVTGAGGAFCAGADLTEFAQASPEEAARGGLARVRLVAEVLDGIRRLEQPTIAAVAGPAVGAGWGLALACDLCFVARDARFRLPEIPKGFRLPGAVMNRLIDIVGPVRAAHIAFSGEVFDAQQALDWGWAGEAAADEASLRERVRGFARALASRPRRVLAGATGPLRRDPRPEPVPPTEYAWNEE